MILRDVELGLCEEVLGLVDARMDLLAHEVDSNPDADSLGILNSIEHLIGFGFVTCQHYLNTGATYITSARGTALNSGPLHDSGLAVAAIANAAANYWRHSSEETKEAFENPSARTREILLAVRIDLEQDHVLANILLSLVSPAPLRFASLLPLLSLWKVGLEE